MYKKPTLLSIKKTEAEVVVAKGLEEEGPTPNPIEMLISSQLTNELEESGIIFISSEITKESLERHSARLLSIHFDDTWPDDREVQIILNSPGGHIDAGSAFIDLMEFVRFPIRTIAVGEIASMATMIFIAGDHRIMSHRSTAMIHHFSTMVGGNYADLIAARKFEDIIYKNFVDHMIANSKYTTEEQVKKHLLHDKDNWLTPQEMILHGLCDEITKVKQKIKKTKAKKAKKKTNANGKKRKIKT